MGVGRVETLEDLAQGVRALLRARRLPFRERDGLAFTVRGTEASRGPVDLELAVRPWHADTWSRLGSYAAREAEHILRSAARTASFVVPGEGDAPAPLVTLDGLGRQLDAVGPPAGARGGNEAHEERRPIAFCAMPFREEFLDVYHLAIAPGAGACGFEPLRLDQCDSFTEITRRIWDGIAKAAVVVADISGHNPNVMYEVGLAHGLGADTFLLCDKGTAIPFDVKDHSVLIYDRGQLHRMLGDFVTRLKSRLAESRA